MLSTSCWLILDGASHKQVTNLVYLKREEAENGLAVMQNSPIWKDQNLSLVERSFVLALGVTDAYVASEKVQQAIMNLKP